MNPLMSMIGSMGGGNNPMSAMMQAIGVINQIQKSRNPQEALNQMAQTNPDIKRAMDMCQGKNPQQVFEEGCRKNGYDPEQFTGMLK
jgi:hypothetical protein|nr:MAG TPA: protein of unknown function (DUF1858) [Caudoviricetes sp.]